MQDAEGGEDEIFVIGHTRREQSIRPTFLSNLELWHSSKPSDVLSSRLLPSQFLAPHPNNVIMADEKSVLLPTTSSKGRKKSGTLLVPFFDGKSSRSVESIGSYLAPPTFRKLSECIFRDITTHKEVLKKHRNQLRRDTRGTLVRERPSSPTFQRRIYFSKFTPRDFLEEDLSLLFRSIEGGLIPNDGLLSEVVLKVENRMMQKLKNQDDARLSQVLESFIKDIQDNYIEGVQKAILDYILNSSQERMRLAVAQPSAKHHFFLTIRAPVPWSSAYKANKASLMKNNLSMLPIMRDIRVLWYNQFAALNFLDKVKFPADVQYFKSQVTINCEIIKSRLMYEWVAEVTNLFVEWRGGINLSLERGGYDFHLMETIATFMSILMRQLIMSNIRQWVRIANNIDRRDDRELFVARADFSPDSQCQLDPSPAEWPRLVVHPINEILRATKSIPRIEQQLLVSDQDDLSGRARKAIENVTEDDLEVLEEKASLLSLVDEKDSSRLLKEAEDKIKLLHDFNRNKRNIFDLNQLRQIIHDQEKFEDEAVYDSEFNWTSGIMLINYSQLRKKIILEAKVTRQALIRKKVKETIDLGHRVCNSFQEIKRRIEQVTDSTEDLMLNMKIMNDFRLKASLLFKDVEFIQDHWTFLTEEGAFHLSDADFELFHALYFWPEVLRYTFDQSDERLGRSKQKTEDKLRERIAQFEGILSEILKSLALFKKKRLSSPLEKIPDGVKLLNEMEDEIDEALHEKQAINYEEGLLGWHELSKFDQLDRVRATKEPLDLLWKTALDFERKHHTWLTLRIQELDLNRVKADTMKLLKRVERVDSEYKEAHEKWGESEGDEDLRQNIHHLRGRLREFQELQLPLLCVITLPVLREKHWMAMSNVLRQKVCVNNFTTLSEVTPETLDQDSVSKIEQIGLIATREHALEMFLARMKNEWISDDWPEDALDIAANKFLEEENMETDLKTECVNTFKYLHEDARSYASNNEHRFLFPVRLTPPAFIELILMFKSLLKKKQQSLTTRKFRYKGGVQKLDMASSFVHSMKKKLIEEDQPRLAKTSRETELLMIRIEEETIDVEWVKERIASDEGLANRAAALAQQIRDECTKELAEAVPAMESAIRALDTLVPDDIVFLRAMKNPPLAMKMVLEAVAILLEFPPERRLDHNGFPFDDYWSAALKMLNSSEVKLLEALKKYDKDHVKPEVMRLVRNCYLSYDDFEPIALRNASIACESLAKWVKALDIYDRVVNVIKPKKKRLFEAEKELSGLLDRVYNKKNELQAITDRLQGLSDNFASISRKKKELEENMMRSEQKVERAVKLLDGLEIEKERWKEVMITLDTDEETLTGDTILASAFIVYLSGMSTDDRNICMKKWHKYLIGKKFIKVSKPFNVVDVAATQLDIQNWILAGLPSEAFNMENATIVANSKRFCLLIDPMGIGTDFIKRMYQSKGLMIVVEEDELSEGLLIQMKKNITRGKPVLLEDVSVQKLEDYFVQKVLAKDIEDSNGIPVCSFSVIQSDFILLFIDSVYDNWGGGSRVRREL